MRLIHKDGTFLSQNLCRPPNSLSSCCLLSLDAEPSPPEAPIPELRPRPPPIPPPSPRPPPIPPPRPPLSPVYLGMLNTFVFKLAAPAPDRPDA